MRAGPDLGHAGKRDFARRAGVQLPCQHPVLFGVGRLRAAVVPLCADRAGNALRAQRDAAHPCRRTGCAPCRYCCLLVFHGRYVLCGRAGLPPRRVVLRAAVGGVWLHRRGQHTGHPCGASPRELHQARSVLFACDVCGVPGAGRRFAGAFAGHAAVLRRHLHSGAVGVHDGAGPAHLAGYAHAAQQPPRVHAAVLAAAQARG